MADPSLPTPRVLRVFDPPMCCSTGVCGPEADPALARFAADLQWLESQGVRVERHTLSQEPELFVRTPAVAEAFARRSLAALPLLLLDGSAVREGGYPTREELANWLDLAGAKTPAGRLRVVTDTGCGPGSGCCG